MNGVSDVFGYSVWQHSKHSRKWLTVLLCSGGAADVAGEGQRPRTWASVRIKRNTPKDCLYALYKRNAALIVL